MGAMTRRLQVLVALAVGCAFGSAATGCAFVFLGTARADSGGEVMTVTCDGADAIQVGVVVQSDGTVTPNMAKTTRVDLPGHTWQELYAGGVTELPEPIVSTYKGQAVNPQGLGAAGAVPKAFGGWYVDNAAYLNCEGRTGKSVSIFVR